MERKEFLKKCNDVVSYWEKKMPMKVMEECAELIQAISKMECETADKFPEEKLIDEIGDVYISLMCLQLYYDKKISELDSKIEKRIEEKLNKKY